VYDWYAGYNSTLQTAFFWAITQRVLVIPYTDVSGQTIVPIFTFQEEGLMTFE
jgi:hypothetical protein